MEAVGGDQRRHVLAAEIDGAAAAKRLGAAHQHEGFIGPGVLDDLIRLDQGSGEFPSGLLRPAREGEALRPKALPRPWLPALLPSAVATTPYSPHMAESSRAVSGSCTAANRHQEVASYQACLPSRPH